MSGIFKSIKKVFKKVGKVVKKIAPYLIIAGAVYFGGSYLMSLYGGASASAAGTAATSFTKSAGVWKSFFSGITNGTAAQSAAAFAEASYQTSIGAGALSLSGQVAAGTSAVNSLNGVLSTQQAVAAGVDFARGAWTQAGGDAQSGWNIIFKGLNQSQAINTGQLNIDAAGSSAITTADSMYDESYGMGQLASHPGQAGHIPGLEGTFTTPEAQRIYALGSDGGATKGFDASKMVGDVTATGGDLGESVIDQDVASATTSTQLTAGGDNTFWKMYMDQEAQNRLDRNSYNEKYLSHLKDLANRRDASNKNQLLWSIAQTGLKTVGSYLTAKDEADYRDRHDPLNWEKKEDEPRWQRGIITG